MSDTNYTALFNEGYHRLLTVFTMHSETSHMLPMWRLVLPIVSLNLSQYIINCMAVAAVQRQYAVETVSLNDSDHFVSYYPFTVYDFRHPAPPTGHKTILIYSWLVGFVLLEMEILGIKVLIGPVFLLKKLG